MVAGADFQDAPATGKTARLVAAEARGPFPPSMPAVHCCAPAATWSARLSGASEAGEAGEAGGTQHGGNDKALSAATNQITELSKAIQQLTARVNRLKSAIKNLEDEVESDPF